jgi:hypothetical protein
MANKQPYWKLVQKNLNEVLGETMSGWLPVVLFQLIGFAGEGLKPVVANRILAICLVGLRSDKILRSDDWQEDIGAVASAVVPNPIQRRLASKALGELFEETVKLQDAFDKNEGGDKDVTKRNLEKAKALLLGLAPSDEDDENKEEKGDKKDAEDKKPAAQHHSVLHIVGTLAEGDSATFWGIVGEAQKHLNEEQLDELFREKRKSRPDIKREDVKLEPGEVPAGDEVLRLVSRVSLTREQLAAIIKAPSGQRRDALLDALRQATSAGGLGEPFARLLDRVARLVETTLPTGSSAGKLRKSMDEKLAELKKNNAKFSGLR